MSLISNTYTNSSGNTSKSYQIGKNRVIVDNEQDGILKFSLYDSTGELTQWKLNSDDNLIEFPTGDKVELDTASKSVLFSLADTKMSIGIVPQNEPQPGTIRIVKKHNIGGEMVTKPVKIGVTDTRYDIPEYGVSKTDIPDTFAVWNAISRAISSLTNQKITPLEDRMLNVENRTTIAENVISIIEFFFSSNSNEFL